VVVSLPVQGSASEVIQAGRVVAHALAAPLHGMLVWPTAIAPAEVARLLDLDAGALEGMVIDVDVGDPAERMGVMLATQPVAFVVLCADDEARDLCCFGDVVSRTLAASNASAIIVRRGVVLPRLSRILVPLDGTPSTAAGLGPAGELAKHAGASLDLVLIEDASAPLSAERGAMVAPHYVDQPQHEWPAFSAEFVQRFIGAIGHCPPGVPTRFFLGAGSPAAEILRFARQLDVDLIALVWSGGCTGDRGLVFRDVVRAAHRPVLVLRRAAA
jgi:nucleotide-binding universal stress UspA family protein